MKTKISIILIFIFCILHIPVVRASAPVTRDIFFPTDKSLELNDNYGDPRYNHSHEGIDIMGPHMTPLYSAVDGTVTYIVIPEASWGYAVEITDSEGWTYHYLHINNDNPGTDDGQGGVEHAYAPGIKRGAKVTRGQLVGWMGDSGNAESAGNHLHFEIRRPGGESINPYASLSLALTGAIEIGGYDPKSIKEAVIDINTDKSINPQANTHCQSNTLIQLEGDKAVYYCGADGKRYVFPNDKIFFTWYEDFADVNTVTLAEIALIPLGGNITYRPGVKLIKLRTDPRVYAVDHGGVLRWIRSSEKAESLYGDDWNQQVDDVADAFFMDYEIGEEI